MSVAEVAASGTYRYPEQSRNTAAAGISFLEQLYKTGEAENSALEAYQQYLKQRYGDLWVQDVGHDQSSMDRLGASTSGTGNVVIAPNILRQMADDPEKAAYYEGQIRHYFDMLPKYQAELSMAGFEIHSSGIVIHADGTVTHYCSGDLKPEVRARINAQIEAEEQAKLKRRKRFLQLAEEAAAERKLQLEIACRRRSITEMLESHGEDNSHLFYADTPQKLISSILAAKADGALRRLS